MAFSGGYYSYGDQFIRNLPIPLSTTAQREQLAGFARELTAKTGELRGLEASMARFPDSVSDERRAAGSLPDLDELGNVGQAQNLAQNIDPANVVDMGESLLDAKGRTTLRIGNGSLALDKAHAALVMATLAERGKMKREELMALRVPERVQEVRGYLEMLRRWKAQIDGLRSEIAALETELNGLVYGLYGLNADERRVVERFLQRF